MICRVLCNKEDICLSEEVSEHNKRVETEEEKSVGYVDVLQKMGRPRSFIMFPNPAPLEVLLEVGMGDKIEMSVEDRLLEVWHHLLLWPVLEDGPNFCHVLTLRQYSAREGFQLFFYLQVVDLQILSLSWLGSSNRSYILMPFLMDLASPVKLLIMYPIIELI